MRPCLFLFFMLLCQIGRSQSNRFSEFYDIHQGADVLLDAVILNNGNWLVVGTSLNLTDNYGHYEGVHLVVDGNGLLLHENRYGEVDVNFNTRAVIQSAYSDAVYSAGYYCDFSVESPGYCDFYFTRLDETGDTLFTKVISRPDTTDLLLSMVETRPNRIMLIGWTYNDTTDADADILLITVDTLGNEVNRVVYGGVGTDFISDGVVVDESGHVILVGYTKSFPSINGGRSWVLKTDSIGNVLWYRTYNGIGASTANGIRAAMLPDGNVIISGGKSGNGYLQKIDTEGNEIWIKLYDVPNGQGLWGVVGLEDGTIVSCGVTDDSNDQAGWLIKTDENGDTLWTRTYDPSDATDYLRNMLVMPNGDIVMVGFGRGENSTTQDGWILRVDSMGCEVENCFMVGIDDRTIDDMRFAIYPNPASDVVRFNVQSSKSNVAFIQAVDVFGRDCFSRASFAMTEVLDVSNWPDGMYVLMLTDADGNRHTQRLVVKH